MNRKLYVVYGILLVIALFTMGLLWKFSHRETVLSPRDFPEIRAEGVLRIVTEYNPVGYYVAGDTVEGFQYELSRAIADLSGLEVEMQLEMNLDNSFSALEGNKCDIVARNLPVTSEWRDDYLFTDPVMLNKQVLVQRAVDSGHPVQPIRNQLDLAGKTLYIPQHSPGKVRLQNLQHEIGDTIYIREDSLYSSEQLIIMVARGDIDYAVCDKKIAEEGAGRFPEIDIRTDISFTQLQSWAVRKDSPQLLDSLNSWFRQLRDNGVYNRIYKRYYAD
ncbi:MAG: transporter substrate-binding domain-containing protein [Parabacteroides sp.]|nr:transporter substrate-binding domain-containing protein [Parabacteroides sp.]